MNITLLFPKHSTKFRFGDAGGKIKKSFSSDQLVSALINNVSLLYGQRKVDEFIDLLTNDEIKVSSLFYGIQFLSKTNENDQATLLFLPRPNVEFKSSLHQKNSMSFKDIKKIKYVSVNLYKKLSASWDEEKELCELDFDSVVIIDKTFAVLQEELNSIKMDKNELSSIKIWQHAIKPGVEVNRIHQQSENFYFHEDLEFLFYETSQYIVRPFMYFIYEETLPPFIKAAIHLLVDEGIGGDRSLGKGYFEKVEFIHQPLKIPKEGKFYMNLSTYFPKKEEVCHLYYYELEKRSGFIYSLGGKTVRKKSTMVIGEGSLVKEQVKGQLVNVTPEGFDHPIYLYGKPILIGFGGEQK